MSNKAFEKLTEALTEALAVARGEAESSHLQSEQGLLANARAKNTIGDLNGDAI